MAKPPSTTQQSDRRSAEGAEAGKPGLVLICSAGQPTLVVTPLARGKILVGRNEMAALAGDQRVSRQHAQVTFDGQTFWVEDLSSRNRTLVDGVAVTPGAPQPARELLSVGESIFLLSQDVQPFQVLGVKVEPDRVVGPAMQSLCRYATSAARTGTSLYITGESGAGKELLAQVFHASRGSAGRPFVAINCSTIPEGVAERLLFGTRRGAFSGADADADGYLQMAHGGTLFLDEVADLALPVQAKLLRALETREVLPLGASRPRPIDISICAASNRPLREEVVAGRFREDLYFRIGQPEVRLPPLRQRREEIPWLLALELKRAAAHLSLHSSLVEACLLRPWPGNVRELLAAIRAAAHLAGLQGETRVEAKHLGPTFGTALKTPAASRIELPPPPPGEPVLESAQQAELVAALRQAAGNVSRAARLLGMHRNQLCRQLSRYAIDARSFKPRGKT